MCHKLSLFIIDICVFLFQKLNNVSYILKGNAIFQFIMQIMNKATEKRDTMLASKFSELELLEVKKEQIDEELKEAEKEFFKFIDDPKKVKSYEEKK